MAILVCVSTGSNRSGLTTCDGDPHRFLAEITTDRLQPVTDYCLIQRSPKRQPPALIGTINDYPRWTEPGLALFARLIESSLAPELCRAAGMLPVQATLLGGGLLGVAPLEVLTTYQLDGKTFAEYQSRFRVHRAQMPDLDLSTAIRDVVLTSARWAFEWGEVTPPPPAALTEVPVHHEHGRAVIHLDDVPKYARPFFAERFDIPDGAKTASAIHWASFVGMVPAHKESLTRH